MQSALKFPSFVISPDNRRSFGFSLVELAIVLICISLLLIGLLGPLRTQLEARERQRAQQDLEEIKEALLGYAVAEGRLPCPDCTAAPCPNGAPNNGLSDPEVPAAPVPPTACSVVQGNVPYATLGVAADDPWRSTQAPSPYRYRVTGMFADYGPAGGSLDPLSACENGPARASFNLCDAGDIVVNNAAGAPIATQIPAIVLSYGENKNDVNLQIGGTASAAEAENTDGDATFVQKDYSRDDAQEFDDIVAWIPLNVLQNRLIQSGFLP
jgi:type II secretory pathway pseudopilin PulG